MGGVKTIDMRAHVTQKLWQKPCAHTKQKHKHMDSKTESLAMCKTAHECIFIYTHSHNHMCRMKCNYAFISSVSHIIWRAISHHIIFFKEWICSFIFTSSTVKDDVCKWVQNNLQVLSIIFHRGCWKTLRALSDTWLNAAQVFLLVSAQRSYHFHVLHPVV